MIERPSGGDDPVPLVPYGPAGDRMPARFAATVDYTEHPLRARIAASFDGTNRVKAEVVSIERTDGASVAPEDMTRLQLGQVMASIVWAATNHGRGTVYQGGRQHDGPPTDDELLTFARMYWFHYVSWGKPRQAVMSAFELSRTTATRWIHKARERYELPGAHAEGDR